MSIMEKFKLNGKIALVTGCSKGIGFGITKGLAEAGADIIGVSSTLDKGSCLLYTSPSPRDRQKSRMPSSA